MKKILTLVLAIFLIGMFNSFAFGKSMRFEKSEKDSNRIQKGLQSIAPNTNTQSTDQINAILDNIKKAMDNQNNLIKQISVKKMSVMKLIAQIKHNRQSLTTDQYNTINTILTSIEAEGKKLVEVKGIKSLEAPGRIKNHKISDKYSVQDLTDILNNLNKNTVSLNTISTSYDSVISVLTVVSKTTPAAITITTSGAVVLPVTTSSAITH